MTNPDAKASARVLVADDEASIRFVLREALEQSGHLVTEATTGDEALEALSAGDFDLAFLDVRMPGPSGIEVLDRLRVLGASTAVVIITAQNTLETAVDAMRLGALDYLVKPFALAEITALTEKTLRTQALQRELNTLRREVREGGSAVAERLVGKSPALLETFKAVGKVAPRNVAVLITGESGTGKEVVARAIHTASPRAEAPFIPVNAAAVPRELLESELFGHERGAFTGAVESRAGRFREADGGTLFLDEIGDMPIELQAKLLRVLQSSEITPVGGRQPVQVDVRILAATHRDLDALVREGRFREDLLYRLRVIPIDLPPLRERAMDISILAEHFVSRYAAELSEGPVALASGGVARLERHPWPGNVRELENAIKRALVLHSGGVLDAEDFDFLGEPEANTRRETTLPDLVREETGRALEDSEPTDLYWSLVQTVERPLLETVLRHTEGNQIRAASLLGINRNTLRKKIVELEIPVPSRRS